MVSLQTGLQAEDADVCLALSPGQHTQLTARGRGSQTTWLERKQGAKTAVDHFVCGNMDGFGYTQEEISIISIILFSLQYFNLKYRASLPLFSMFYSMKFVSSTVLVILKP